MAAYRKVKCGLTSVGGLMLRFFQVVFEIVLGRGGRMIESECPTVDWTYKGSNPDADLLSLPVNTSQRGRSGHQHEYAKYYQTKAPRPHPSNTSSMSYRELYTVIHNRLYALAVLRIYLGREESPKEAPG